MGATSSVPTEEAASRLTPTEQREIPKQGSPPSECPMHSSSPPTAYQNSPPSECPMQNSSAAVAQPPSGCPMHKGNNNKNDIDPTNMVII